MEIRDVADELVGFVAEFAQNAPVRGGGERHAAGLSVRAHRDRGAQDETVALEREVLVEHPQNVLPFAALETRHEHDVRLFRRETGDVFVEIAVVADQRREADAVDREHGRRVRDKCVTCVRADPGLFGAGQVLFAEVADDVPFAVEEPRGVAENAGRDFEQRTQADDRVTAFRGVARGFEQGRGVFAGERDRFPGGERGGRVRVFRSQDDVAISARIEFGDEKFDGLFRLPVIVGVGDLDGAEFHGVLLCRIGRCPG